MAFFIKSAIHYDASYCDLEHEICFIGRSNVGKSSIINALAQKKIAFSSKTPGRTQCINFYNFEKFILVDLPGYGYAQTSHLQKQKIQEILSDYIANSTKLFIVMHVCDANVITNEDLKYAQLLQKKFANYFLLLNKTDKLNIKSYQHKIQEYKKLFKISEQQIVFISAKAKININVIKNKISSLL